ncbi:MAG: glycosyltransferase family 2 protein [Lautropia sp.]
MIALSVISHGQAAIAGNFLRSFAALRPPAVSEIIYTRNLPEAAPPELDIGRTRLTVIDNPRPRGFGENHNAAFARTSQPWFCIINPDIVLLEDPFPALLRAFEADPRLGVAGPLVLSPERSVENTARRLYTPAELIAQKLRPRNQLGAADWLAGMFLMFRSDAYRRIGGFDERFFLYIEDVDICTRLRVAGYQLRQQTEARVVHDAQKRSHRSLRYASWHLRNMLRYWCTPSFWQYRAMLRRQARAS